LAVAWQRLSQRRGIASPDGPYEGVPEHMRPHVLNWFAEISALSSRMQTEAVIRHIAMELRLPAPPGPDVRAIGEALLNRAGKDQDFCLDLLDIALHLLGDIGDTAPQLEMILRASGSVWKVASNGRALELVVDKAMQATYEAAILPQDEAAAELAEAWAKAFGRSLDPSDAWDHAIKAVECVLIPVVVPNKPKATLGNVVGTLGSAQSASNWKMILPNNTLNYDADALASLLRMLWPNHDRHGSGVTPSIDEARAVVCLAATLVQWHRQAWIVQKR
jgi:hypothetical protein